MERSASGAEPSAPRSLARLGFLNALSASSALLFFLLFVVAGRTLGPEDFGRFSFAFAFVLFFDVLLDPGLYHLLIREVARRPADLGRLLGHALGWKLLLGPVVLAAATLGAGVLHDDAATLRAVGWLAGAHVLRSLKDSFRATLLAREHFGLDALSNLFERGGLLVAGAAVLLAGYGLPGLCVAFVAVRALDLALVTVLARRVATPVRPALELRFLRGLLRVAAPIGGFYVTLSVYSYLDTVMISVLRGETEVGWYSAAYRLYEGTFLLPTIIGTVLLPRLSVAFAGDRARFRRLLEQGIRFTMLAGTVVAANAVALTAPVIGLAFGSAYAPAVPAGLVLFAGLPVVFAVNLLHSTLIAMDRQRVLLGVALGGLALNGALNAALVPVFGYVAAAAVTVGVELCVGIALALGSRGALPAQAWRRAAGRPLLRVALGTGLVLVAAMGLAWPLRLVAVNGALALLLTLTGVIERGERDAARAWLRARVRGAAGRSDG